MPHFKTSIVLPALLLLALALIATARAPDEAQPQAIPQTGGEALIGRLIALPPLRDFGGGVHVPANLLGAKATVIAMTDLTCPIAMKYRPALARLEDGWRDRGVRFIYLDSSGTDSPEQVVAAAKQFGFEGPWINDADRSIANLLGATTTTEVFVLDAARTLIYRGAIDDQHSLGGTLPAPRNRYLADALAAVVDGGRPKVSTTSAPGCVLDLSRAPPLESRAITYHNRISRIIADNCMTCHRAGGVAPFALDSYDAVAKRADMISFVLGEGIMPPWHAAPTDDPSLAFINDRTVPPLDKADLLAWLESDKPAGDPAEAPLPRAFPDDWQIGAPDVIFQIPQPLNVPAEGLLDYQYIRVPTNFTEDKWIKALQLKPTDRRVVHHILVFAIPPADLDGTPEARQRLRQTFAESAGFFAAYVPGNDHVTFRDGLAKRVPAGATLIFQLHYTPNGVATTDQTQLGLAFADGPPQHELMVRGIVDRRLNIPPGASDHEEGAEIPVSRDAILVGLMPHMHVRGRSMRYDLTLPDGTVKTLLNVPRYDFNWQTAYRFAEPLPIPAGSRIKVTAIYDNSESNPANPDPAATVNWGPMTTDEMCIGYVEFYYPEQKPK